MESSRASRLLAGTSRDIIVDSAAELAILEREGVLLPRRLQTLTFGGEYNQRLEDGSPCLEAVAVLRVEVHRARRLSFRGGL